MRFLSPAQSLISFSMFESFSRGSILRLAKCPFFNPDHLFPFRDAVDEKNNDNKKQAKNCCELILLFYFLSLRVSRALF